MHISDFLFLIATLAFLIGLIWMFRECDRAVQETAASKHRESCRSNQEGARESYGFALLTDHNVYGMMPYEN